MQTLKSLSIILFSLLLCFTSCKKDEEGFIPNPDGDIEEVMYTSDIYGVVTHRDDSPISGAEVQFKGDVTYTDEDGIYKFSDVSVGSQHNVVTIKKSGYFENARTFRSAGSSTQYQRTILQEKNFDLSFNTSENATISSGKVSLRFTPESIMVDGTKEDYSGEVQIAIFGIDPTSFRLEEFMPGDLTARTDDGEILTLESYGMVNVELQAPDGTKLQVKEGKTVSIDYEVTDVLLENAPQTIDLWSFDFERGIWMKEGLAQLDNGIYSGEVSHFSCWNYDVSAPSVVVSGKIVSEGFALPYYRVTILNAENKGGRGWTDSEGVFSGRVEQGVELTLTIYHYHDCDNGIIYQQEVGPFDNDTDLGTITVNPDDVDFLLIQGKAVDCDLNPVEDGRVFVYNNWSFPIVDGEINLSLPVCDVQTFDLRVVDATSLTQTFIENITAPGDYTFEQVVVCGDEANHIRLNDLLGSPLNIIDSLGMYKYSTPVDDVFVSIDGWLWDDLISVGVDIDFYLGNAFSNPQLEEKDYEMERISIYYNDDLGAEANYYLAEGQTGQVIITSISEGIGNILEVRGVFTADCTEEVTQGTKTLTGSFKMSYQE